MSETDRVHPVIEESTLLEAEIYIVLLIRYDLYLSSFTCTQGNEAGFR